MIRKTCVCGRKYIHPGVRCGACAACVVCGVVKKVTRSGECRSCVGVRANRTTMDRADDHEPTAAEVEAMVAEQMQNLPAWWQHSDKCSRPPRVPGGKVATSKPNRKYQRGVRYE